LSYTKSFSGVQGAVFQKSPLAAGGINGPDRGVKNYFFIYDREHPRIDLLRKGSSRGQNYYGKLFLSITALQDIFIGSGEIDKNARQLYDAFTYVMTGSGKQAWNIPGSSLKGCIYTHLALFLQSRSMDFFSAKESPAKVFFSDLPMAPGTNAAIKEIPARFSPRAVPEDAMVKLYKKEYRKDTLPQGSYNTDPGQERLQAIRVGSRFEGHLHFKQLDEYEITMLVLALGSMPGSSFNFKIGGAKNRAMGLVRLQVDFEKSFYARTLKDIAVKNVLPFAGLKPGLEKTLSKLKQEYPALDLLLKKIQGEYGQ
jgi:hypothetical protein